MHLVTEHIDAGRAGVDLIAPPLEWTLGHLLRRAQQVHTALWSTEFDGLLTGPQYALLSVIAGTTLDQRSAGRRASLDKSTAADVVARLRRNGWLVHGDDPSDGRRRTLRLSATARAALSEVTPRAGCVQARLLSALDPSEQRALIGLLARVVYRGGEPPEQPSEAPTQPLEPGPPVLALSATPGHLLRCAEQLHGGFWSERIGRALTPSQYALMCVLARSPGIDQTAAGELASLDKSSAADIAARLIRRGWIAAAADRDDRRRKLLALTEAAIAVLGSTTPRVTAVQRDLGGGLSPDAHTQLLELLRTVAFDTSEK